MTVPRFVTDAIDAGAAIGSGVGSLGARAGRPRGAATQRRARLEGTGDEAGNGHRPAKLRPGLPVGNRARTTIFTSGTSGGGARSFRAAGAGPRESWVSPRKPLGPGSGADSPMGTLVEIGGRG